MQLWEFGVSRPLRRAANVPLFRQSDYEVMPPTGDTTLPDAADPNAATNRSPPSLGLAATVRMTYPPAAPPGQAPRASGAQRSCCSRSQRHRVTQPSVRQRGERVAARWHPPLAAPIPALDLLLHPVCSRQWFTGGWTRRARRKSC